MPMPFSSKYHVKINMATCSLLAAARYVKYTSPFDTARLGPSSAARQSAQETFTMPGRAARYVPGFVGPTARVMDQEPWKRRRKPICHSVDWLLDDYYIHQLRNLFDVSSTIQRRFAISIGHHAALHINVVHLGPSLVLSFASSVHILAITCDGSCVVGLYRSCQALASQKEGKDNLQAGLLEPHIEQSDRTVTFTRSSMGGSGANT